MLWVSQYLPFTAVVLLRLLPLQKQLKVCWYTKCSILKIYCNMQCKNYFPFNRISVFRLPYPSLLYAFRQFPPRYSQTSKLSSLLKSFSRPIPFSSLKRQSFSTPYVVPSPIDALPLPASLKIKQQIGMIIFCIYKLLIILICFLRNIYVLITLEMQMSCTLFPG